MKKAFLLALLPVLALSAPTLVAYGLHEGDYDQYRHTLERPRNSAWQIVRNAKAEPKQSVVEEANRDDGVRFPPLLTLGAFLRPSGPSLGTEVALDFRRGNVRGSRFCYGLAADFAIRWFDDEILWYGYYETVSARKPAVNVRGSVGIELPLATQLELVFKTALGGGYDPAAEGLIPQLDFSGGLRFWLAPGLGLNFRCALQIDDFDAACLALSAGVTFPL